MKDTRTVTELIAHYDGESEEWLLNSLEDVASQQSTEDLFARQIVYIRKTREMSHSVPISVKNSLISRFGIVYEIAPVLLYFAALDIEQLNDVRSQYEMLIKLETRVLKRVSVPTAAECLLLKSKCCLYLNEITRAEAFLNESISLSDDETPLEAYDLQADIFFVNSKVQDSARIRLQMFQTMHEPIFDSVLSKTVLTLVLLPLSPIKAAIMKDFYERQKTQNGLTDTERTVLRAIVEGRLIPGSILEAYLGEGFQRGLPRYYLATGAPTTAIIQRLRESVFEGNISCVASSCLNITVKQLAEVLGVTPERQAFVEDYVCGMILDKKLDATIDGITGRIHFNTRRIDAVASDISHVTEFFARKMKSEN
ncbi:unnamed protein product [Kuraishia capsulata CBS 1993]|uniref:PCI domain-containing protein n=1 Tax=Kuraishia capsulata CBS 1993 TaxID=1382522 RepID=W6MNL6_9ASCO|nr:uncharacterized protein KUCA_T00002615001 [Kuraishia capsulata CBS 1993]CDK26642.1 unnamed protein product [Kuraishia capsulata CBS 1993]